MIRRATGPIRRNHYSLGSPNNDVPPELDSRRGQALRTLLYLFQRDAAVRYLRSG